MMLSADQSQASGVESEPADRQRRPSRRLHAPGSQGGLATTPARVPGEHLAMICRTYYIVFKHTKNVCSMAAENKSSVSCKKL